MIDARKSKVRYLARGNLKNDFRGLYYSQFIDRHAANFFMYRLLQPLLNFQKSFPSGTFTTKIFTAVIVACHDKLECLPLPFTFTLV
jgi:hypothetical protein